MKFDFTPLVLIIIFIIVAIASLIFTKVWFEFIMDTDLPNWLKYALLKS